VFRARSTKRGDLAEADSFGCGDSFMASKPQG
jgi:hypothetical protein